MLIFKRIPVIIKYIYWFVVAVLLICSFLYVLQKVWKSFGERSLKFTVDTI